MSRVNKLLKLAPWLTLLLMLTTFLPALAGAVFGLPFPIADSINLDENHPAVAYNPDRKEYLAVWHNDGLKDNLQAQRLDQHGQKIGSAFFISQGDNHLLAYPDVAYNSQHGQYLVVWENMDGDGWISIQGRRIAGDGTVLDDSDLLISYLDEDVEAYNPAVAYSASADRYVVVWAEMSVSPTAYHVFARKVPHTDNPEGVKIEISQSPYLHRNPDIAYNPGIHKLLVVWEQYSNVESITQVRGRLLTGNVAFENDAFTFDPGRDTSITNPAVAAISNPSGAIKFMVVAQNAFTSTDFDILGYFLNQAGNVTLKANPAQASSSETSPAVSGSEASGEYLVAWREDAAAGDKPIKARRYDLSGDNIYEPYTLDAANANYPAVAAGALGSFLLAWQDQPLSAATDEIYGALFGRWNYLPLINR